MQLNLSGKRNILLQIFKTTSPEETEQIGSRLAKTLSGTEVIAMFGSLGAGKTAFTRGFAEALGVNDGVSSPTFALVHEYKGKFSIYHFDMYRVASWDDLYTTGFFDYMESGIMIIEWSENIVDFLPDDRIDVTIRHISDNEREIQIEGAKEL